MFAWAFLLSVTYIDKLGFVVSHFSWCSYNIQWNKIMWHKKKVVFQIPKYNGEWGVRETDIFMSFASQALVLGWKVLAAYSTLYPFTHPKRISSQINRSLFLIPDQELGIRPLSFYFTYSLISKPWRFTFLHFRFTKSNSSSC